MHDRARLTFLCLKGCQAAPQDKIQRPPSGVQFIQLGKPLLFTNLLPLGQVLCEDTNPPLSLVSDQKFKQDAEQGDSEENQKGIQEVKYGGLLLAG